MRPGPSQITSEAPHRGTCSLTHNLRRVTGEPAPLTMTSDASRVGGACSLTHHLRRLTCDPAPSHITSDPSQVTLTPHQ